MATTTHLNETAKPKNYFATTHWSIVLAASGSDPDAAAAALEKLCQGYWYPLYAYVRRRGYPFKTGPKRQVVAYAPGNPKKGTESGQTLFGICASMVGPEGFEPPTKRL